MKVSGVAGTLEVVTAIKNGEAVATAAIDAAWQGGMGLSLAIAAKNGEIKPEELPLEKREWMAGAIMVTEENIDWFFENYIEGTPEYDWLDYWGRWVKGLRD